jgi:hypothetical protein
MFQLFCPNMTFVLVAKTVEEKDEWLQHLATAISRLIASSSDVRGTLLTLSLRISLTRVILFHRPPATYITRDLPF